jgi:hypothetical protein
MLGMKNQDRAAGDAARRIKTWAREILDPDGAATVLVSELACSEPGCPPVETVVALLRGPGDTVKYTIHRPSAEITRADVAGLAAEGSR